MSEPSEIDSILELLARRLDELDNPFPLITEIERLAQSHRRKLTTDFPLPNHVLIELQRRFPGMTWEMEWFPGKSVYGRIEGYAARGERLPKNVTAPDPYVLNDQRNPLITMTVWVEYNPGKVEIKVFDTAIPIFQSAADALEWIEWIQGSFAQPQQEQ